MNVFELPSRNSAPLHTRRTILSLMLALVTSQAAAQSAPPPPAEESAGRADAAGDAVVTVTANRRREPAREVPMQVNTLSVQQLEQSGAKSLSDYLGDQPGVDVKNGAGAGFGSISIRGVSTGNQTIATVGTYIDDVAFGSSSPFALGSVTALDMGLLDLHHIELLRGPQGTLYGAGAMGGLLKYVTNEPNTSEFSGKLTLGASATRDGKAGHTESGVFNIPLKEDVAGMRVSLFRDQIGGYVDAVGKVAGQDVNGGHNTGARLSVLIEPSARMKVRLTATGQQTVRDSSDYVDYDAVTGKPKDGALMRRGALLEPYKMTVGVVGADIEYDLGWARLNSITAAQQNKIDLQLDYTGVYAPLLVPVGLNLATVPVSQSTSVHKWTQEFRLTSPAKRPLEWLAGLYYDDQRGSNHQAVSSTLAQGGAAGPVLALADLPSTYRELAAYGDLTWNATPRLALTGGLRVARNRQTFQQKSSGLVIGEASELSADSAETSKTYLATARYALTPTSNVYVRAASGYRPGGPNAVLKDFQTGVAAAPPTFNHDSLWSYEAGYKADLLGKTLSFESSVYDIRWDQIQQFFAVNGLNVIVNGGKAHIQGAELATRYRPTAQWNLAGALSYVDARLSEDAPGLGKNGTRLPNSARLSASLSVQYSFDVDGHAAYLGWAGRYVGERNAGFDDNQTLPNYRLPAYQLSNLQGGINFGRLQLALYLNNAFDKRAQLNAATAFVPYGAPVNVTTARPRTFGMALTSTF